MHQYRYKLSLRITHPDLEPQAISSTLGLVPEFSNKAGDLRKTPKGVALDGKYPNSYWCHEFTKQDGTSLSEYLLDTAKALDQHKSFFTHIADTGGKIEFFVGMFMDGPNIGETIACDILEQLNSLHIALSLDIYA